MNTQFKTILLTILTLSVLTIALVELGGVSSTALFNKYGIGNGGHQLQEEQEMKEEKKRERKANSMPKTEITFDNTKHNFGTIKEGEIVKHSYHFKNTGNNPLLITKAIASCGCTVPSFPKEPIPPGGEGDILVEFNSNHREGKQQKNVLVYSNAQQASMSIGFEVFVEKK